MYIYRHMCLYKLHMYVYMHIIDTFILTYVGVLVPETLAKAKVKQPAR